MGRTCNFLTRKWTRKTGEWMSGSQRFRFFFSKENRHFFGRSRAFKSCQMYAHERKRAGEFRCSGAFAVAIDVVLGLLLPQHACCRSLQIHVQVHTPPVLCMCAPGICHFFIVLDQNFAAAFSISLLRLASAPLLQWCNSLTNLPLWVMLPCCHATRFPLTKFLKARSASMNCRLLPIWWRRNLI